MPDALEYLARSAANMHRMDNTYRSDDGRDFPLSDEAFRREDLGHGEGGWLPYQECLVAVMVALQEGEEAGVGQLAHRVT